MISVKFKVPEVNDRWWESSRNEIARVLQRENEASWKAEEDPNTGAKWAPRKQPTGTWPILNRTGRMQERTKIKPAGGVGLFSARTVSYGPFHQYGTSRMTARPWLGVPDRTLDPIAGIIAKNILKNRR